MQQTVDRPSAFLSRRIQRDASIAVARALPQARPLFEHVVLFAAVSFLWGILLYTALSTL